MAQLLQPAGDLLDAGVGRRRSADARPAKRDFAYLLSNREGLEDRVYRIKTERSGASTPEPRTTHIISNVELLGESDEGLEVRYSWVTWSHRYQHTDAFFGATCCTLTEQDAGRRSCAKPCA